MDNEATKTSSENVYTTNEHQKKPSEKGSDSKDCHNNPLDSRGDQEGTIKKCENGNMIPLATSLDSTDQSDTSNAKLGDDSSVQKLKVTSVQNLSNESDPTSEDIKLKWDDDLDDENNQPPGLLDERELSKHTEVGPDDVSHPSDIFRTKDVADEEQAMDIDPTEDLVESVVKSPEVSKTKDEVSSSELLSDSKNNDEFNKSTTDVEKKSTTSTDMEVEISENTDNNDSYPKIDLDETSKEVETFLLELENNDSTMKGNETEESTITDFKDKQSNPAETTEDDFKNTDAIANTMDVKSLFESATIGKNKELISVEFTAVREQPKSSSCLDVDKPMSSPEESVTEPKLDISKQPTELSVDLPTSSDIIMMEHKQSNPAEATEDDSKNTDAIANTMEVKSLVESASIGKNKELISVEFTAVRKQPKSSSCLDVDKPISSPEESVTEPKLDISKQPTELSVDLPTSSDIIMMEHKQSNPAEATEDDSKNTDAIAYTVEVKSLFDSATIGKNNELTSVEFTAVKEQPKSSSCLDVNRAMSSPEEMITEPKLDISKQPTELSVDLPTSSDINMMEDVKVQEATLELPAKTSKGDEMIVPSEEISKIDQDVASDTESTELPSKIQLKKKVDLNTDIENFISLSVPIQATSEIIETNDMIDAYEEISNTDQDITTDAASIKLPTKTPLQKKADPDLDIENFIASAVPIAATIKSELIESNDRIDSSDDISKIYQGTIANAESTELLTKTASEKKVNLDLDIENFIASSVPITLSTVKSELIDTNEAIAYASDTKDSTEHIASKKDDIKQRAIDISDQAKLSSHQDDEEEKAIESPFTLTAFTNENADMLSSSTEPSISKDQASLDLSSIQSLNIKEMASDLSEEPNLSSSTDIVQANEEPILSSSTEVDQRINDPIPSLRKDLGKTEESITPSCTKDNQANKDPVPSSSKDLEAIEEPLPSSSKKVGQTIEDPILSSSKQFDELTEEPTPSTSKYQSTDEPASTMDLDVEQMAPDASDEIPEVTDSLGLLAESKVRVVDEEEDQEDDDDGDDEEDGDDDQDDESNVPTAEHSEDSNQQTSETETPKDPADQSENSFTGKLREKKTSVDVEAGESDLADVGGDKDDLEMDVDETSEDKSSEPLTPETVVLPTIAAVSSVDMETVKLSDTSDSEINSEAEGKQENISILKEILVKPVESAIKSPVKDKPMSPSKKKLEISQPKTVLNIVDLEESSSEDDIQVVNKDAVTTAADTPDDVTNDNVDPQVTTVNIPKEVDIISAATGATLELEDKEGETVIKGVPKPVTTKKAKLNTSEISIKTTTASESTLVIPETKVADIAEKKVSKPKFGLEVFNLDSDDENSVEAKQKEKPVSPLNPPSPRLISRCVNPMCTSDASVDRISASAAILRFYDVSRRRKAKVCRPCADCVAERSFGLVSGVMSMRPLLEIEMSRSSQQLVEISDSDSDGETEDATARDADKIGAGGATFLEEQLADIINSTWRKYNLDDRLRVAKDQITEELEKLENERLEIDAMLNVCQANTDKLRLELYATFATNTRTVPALDIMDTPFAQYSTAVSETESNIEETEVRRSKRKTTFGPIPKKEPIETSVQSADAKDDDNTDIKVVKLSAEVAPVDLPPSGTLVRPTLMTGQTVFAMRHAFGSWLMGTVQDIYPKGATPISSQFTICKVRFEHKVKNPVAQISARHMAYPDPANVRLTIGTRVIALFSDITDATKRRSYYSGVIAEMPNPVNSYRYLVFFDDGYAQYVTHAETRVVCECSSLVWEEVHPFSREFVRQYLVSYPERPMVRLHAGQSLKTEWNGKWWVSKVIKVDASLVQIYFEADDRTEWIYRGSTRLAPLYLELQNAERPRARPLPRSTQHRQNTPYVEYTRSDELEAKAVQAQKYNEDFKRQRAVAKKSTAMPTTTEHRPPPAQQQPLDNVMSRVVYYTPKAAVKPHKMQPHTCSPQCKRTDVLPLKELRTYNPLARPLLSGWERQILRFKGRKEVMYRAPCGRRLRDLAELHRYLRATNSEMGVDLFDFAVTTHCLAEFVLNRCLVSKKDLSHGKENVPVPCVNYYDNSLPEFCSYNTERTPTAGVPLNLDPDFLCGCDCTDDCQDKSKCACWKMTLDGAHTIGMDIDDIGYVYKRLLDPVPSGIYECNSRCKCKQTCLNRVAQHPLQLKLQVFKTLNRGWGIRALNDVPRGSFLCVYAGNLLTDATANLDGLNEGDEYLAELDYIEVVEQMKEGYEAEIPDKDKELDKKKSESDDEEEGESSSSEDERREKEREKQDNDFRPAYEIPAGCLEFNKRLRKRDKKRKDKNKGSESQTGEQKGDDCITISDDDEEVREPQRFAAQAGMGANDFISKHMSVRTLFGKDEACYIMDAKVQGNIGRYLNHSCTPNVFVQNVFVDTHDPRFPWVAFFALCHIRAGTELTWNYNYDVGSVPGKILYCYCGASNCRGRLL